MIILCCKMQHVTQASTHVSNTAWKYCIEIIAQELRGTAQVYTRNSVVYILTQGTVQAHCDINKSMYIKEYNEGQTFFLVLLVWSRDNTSFFSSCVVQLSPMVYSSQTFFSKSRTIARDFFLHCRHVINLEYTCI